MIDDDDGAMNTRGGKGPHIGPIEISYRPCISYFGGANLKDAPEYMRRALEPIEIAFSAEGRNPLRATAAWIGNWWFAHLEGHGSAHVRGDEALFGTEYLLLVLTLSGQNRPSGTIRFLPRPGEMALMPWTAGDFISAGEFKNLFAFLPKAHLVATGCAIDELPLSHTVSTLRGAGAPLASALRTLAVHAGRADGRDDLAVALPSLSQMIVDVFSAATQPHVIKSAPEERIQHVLSYLEDHIELRDLTARQAATACGLSVRQLFRSFNELGMSFSETLKKMRLERACDLLAFQPRLSIAEIASTTGFSSSSHFARTFRTELGKTPFQYRETQVIYRSS